MLNPEHTHSKEQDTTVIPVATLQQLAQVAHESFQADAARHGDWVEILDYCTYWGLDIPGLPIQGTP